MTRTRMALVIGLALAALAAAGCGGDNDEAGSGDTTDATEATTTETSEGGISITGNVGPGFEISLVDSGGQDVSSLSAGHYTIAVTDNSDIHNFHLTGPAVDETTDVSGEGETTFEVDLEAGTYTFVCDPHASQMTGSFEVTG